MTCKVKICGVTRVEDVEVAIAAGADAIGVNLWPSSPRAVSLAVAKTLCEAIADRVRAIAVVVDPLPDLVDELGVHFDRIQLHGNEDLDVYRLDRKRLWKAVRLVSHADVDAAAKLRVDAVLVDAPAGPGATPGGTGRSADWRLAKELAQKRPTWLAGGLRPDNVALAIAAVRPFGVDVASGVERRPGEKDPDLVAAFVRAAKGSP